MSYLVMECHKAYAIVLSQDKRFLKVANLNYTVGQKLDKVFELQEVQQDNRSKFVIRFASLAASFLLLTAGTWQLGFAHSATVHMRINPALELDVNRLGYVLEIRAANADADDLLEGKRFKTKKVKDMLLDLSLLAEKEHYLDEDPSIYLYVDAANKNKAKTMEEKLGKQLQESLHEELSEEIEVYIGKDDYQNSDPEKSKRSEESPSEGESIAIPVETEQSEENTVPASTEPISVPSDTQPPVTQNPTERVNPNTGGQESHPDTLPANSPVHESHIEPPSEDDDTDAMESENHTMEIGDDDDEPAAHATQPQNHGDDNDDDHIDHEVDDDQHFDAPEQEDDD